MPPGTWFQARVVYTTAANKQCEAILWYRTEDVVSGSTILSLGLATNVSQNIEAELKNVLTINATFNGVVGSLHVGPDTWTAEYRDDAGPGIVSGDELPDFAAACIRKRGDQAGRSGMGRWFLAGIPESYTEGNGLTSMAGGPAYDSLGDAFIEDITGGGTTFTASHYSRVLNTFGGITETSTDAVIKRQSRRQFSSLI